MKLATFHSDPLPQRDPTSDGGERPRDEEAPNFAEPGADGIVFSVLCVVGSVVVYFLMLLV